MNIVCTYIKKYLFNRSKARNGTCYTSTECSDKGGKVSGNCAAGYVLTCENSKENNRHIKSEFPT